MSPNVLREMEAKVAPIPGVEQHELEALGSLFEQAGLAEVTLRTIEVELTYPDFEAYWRRFIENRRRPAFSFAICRRRPRDFPRKTQRQPARRAGRNHHFRRARKCGEGGRPA